MSPLFVNSGEKKSLPPFFIMKYQKNASYQGGFVCFLIADRICVFFTKNRPQSIWPIRTPFLQPFSFLPWSASTQATIKKYLSHAFKRRSEIRILFVFKGRKGFYFYKKSPPKMKKKKETVKLTKKTERDHNFNWKRLTSNFSF